MITLKTAKRYIKSPLHIPAAKSGPFCIAHDKISAHTCIDVITTRTAFLTGQSSLKIQYEKDITIHRLEKNGDVLMTDSPAELFDMAEAVHRAKGHVLIGGLGLGCVAMKIANKMAVESVTVVEKEQHVVNLVLPYMSPRPQIVLADLFVFLKTIKKYPFNFSFFDIYIMEQGKGSGSIA